MLIKGPDVAPIDLCPSEVLFPRSTALVQVQGIGSTAKVIQGDIPACGNSVVHVVDTVLLVRCST